VELLLLLLLFVSKDSIENSSALDRSSESVSTETDPEFGGGFGNWSASSVSEDESYESLVPLLLLLLDLRRVRDVDLDLPRLPRPLLLLRPDDDDVDPVDPTEERSFLPLIDAGDFGGRQFGVDLGAAVIATATATAVLLMVSPKSDLVETVVAVDAVDGDFVIDIGDDDGVVDDDL
jgi:hypothetical protein